MHLQNTRVHTSEKQVLVVLLRRVRNTSPGVSAEDSRPVTETGPGELGKCSLGDCILGGW